MDVYRAGKNGLIKIQDIWSLLNSNLLKNTQTEQFELFGSYFGQGSIGFISFYYLRKRHERI